MTQGENMEMIEDTQKGVGRETENEMERAKGREEIQKASEEENSLGGSFGRSHQII